MIQQALTMHWHGFHMKETPWMDGVATITQCPISPGSSFVYRFIASPQGTLWYHAHLGGLRADGAFGLFIVHKTQPEMIHYPLIAQHWLHIPFDEFMATNPYKKKLYGDIAGDGSHQHQHLEKVHEPSWKAGDGVPLTSMIHVSDLINGRGQFNDNNAPLAWFNVSHSSEVGFHILNPGVEYSYNISIDQHTMTIIGLGIGEVEPMAVDAIYLNPGERVHVKIQLKDNQTNQNYWIRAKTLANKSEVKAVLHYPGVFEEPESHPRSCTEQSPCSYYNW